jgi:hypothetical protein
VDRAQTVRQHLVAVNRFKLANAGGTTGQSACRKAGGRRSNSVSGQPDSSGKCLTNPGRQHQNQTGECRRDYIGHWRFESSPEQSGKRLVNLSSPVPKCSRGECRAGLHGNPNVAGSNPAGLHARSSADRASGMSRHQPRRHGCDMQDEEIGGRDDPDEFRLPAYAVTCPTGDTPEVQDRAWTLKQVQGDGDVRAPRETQSKF